MALGPYVPSEKVRAKMQQVLARRASWVPARSVRGAFYVIQSSDGKHVYYVGRRGEACTCEGARRFEFCSHMWAVREALTQDVLRDHLADEADKLLDEYDWQRENDAIFAGLQRVNVDDRVQHADVVDACEPCAPLARREYAWLYPEEDD